MTSLPNDRLDLAVLLYKRVEQRQIVGRNVEAALPDDVDFQEAIEALEQAELLVAESQAGRKIEFSLPTTFFFSLAEFLANASRRIQAPERFYLADLDFFHETNGAQSPPAIRWYLSVLEIFRLLRQLADHEVSMGGRIELVFLGKDKLLITPDYAEDDLREIKGLSSLENEFFASDAHKDQKATILKTVLIEMYGNRKKVDLRDLLARFEEIVERAHNNYQLYVAEFSFEKVKAEVEKEKTEFTTRLNKVFSDIQNQLLAIPAALILIGGQMEDAGRLNMKNSLIWLGALVFSILISLLIRNQRNTLHVIWQEFDMQWKRMQESHQAIAGAFSSAYRQLDRRYHHQLWLLRTVDILVAGAFMVSSALLARYSGYWCNLFS